VNAGLRGRRPRRRTIGLPSRPEVGEVRRRGGDGQTMLGDRPESASLHLRVLGRCASLCLHIVHRAWRYFA
jgi:hypothetical protein